MGGKIFLTAGFFALLGCATNTANTANTAAATVAPPPPASPVSPADTLVSVQCGIGEFRGLGIGASEEEALNFARSSIARQVHSSIKVSEKQIQSQRVLNGNETLRSEFVMETAIESALSNAHDARVQRVVHSASGVGIVACMSREDAAKGFIQRQRLVADSLEFAANASLETKHPKRKNEAWHRTQALWNEFSRLQAMLDGFGAEKADYWEPLNATYAQAREAYLNYCKAQKLHWEDIGNECSDAMFSILSGKVKMEKTECQSGLKFKLTCLEKCTPSSFGGVECSFVPSLSVESCEGESYLLLKAQKPATGRDMHNASKAKGNLIEKLPSTEFMGEWEKELKSWMPLCAE